MFLFLTKIVLKKEVILSFFVSIFLCSCVVGKSTTTGLSSNIAVRVVSQFSDSLLRTTSGKPYISLQGGPRICRHRPFSLDIVRDELLKSGVPRDTLNDYIFFDLQEESEDEEETGAVIFEDVGDNWIKFGLQIANNTEFALIINSVRIHGRAKCGQIYTHSSEISSGYCAGVSNAPFLYVVPPNRQIEYQPLSRNPFHNLTLYFSGFPIEDRRSQPSKRFEDSIRDTTTDSAPTGGTAELSERQQECQQDREDYAIPKYRIEVTLTGYFIGLTSEYITVDFFKRVTFFTTVIY